MFHYATFAIAVNQVSTDVGNFIRNMCLYLERKGFKTMVITGSDGSEFPDDDFLKTNRVIRINITRVKRFKDLYIAIIAAYKLIIHRNDYELIHVQMVKNYD